eukprot:2187769-Rhodomonas_salina.3
MELDEGAQDTDRLDAVRVDLRRRHRVQVRARDVLNDAQARELGGVGSTANDDVGVGDCHRTLHISAPCIA